MDCIVLNLLMQQVNAMQETIHTFGGKLPKANETNSGKLNPEIFRMGMNTYYLEKPIILIIGPNEMIFWKNPGDESTENYCLRTKPHESIIRLPSETPVIGKRLSIQHHKELPDHDELGTDQLPACMQLIRIANMQPPIDPAPDIFSGESRHVRDFFRLLETETSNINHTNPIRIKTAKEFADNLAVHPNHLNALMKKHTGHNVSTLIKRRLLHETKVLLLKTDWTLFDISYAMGFAEQPNFSQFFKKNVGISPAAFRRRYSSKKLIIDILNGNHMDAAIAEMVTAANVIGE